ncbi:MAG: hypothetical protein ABSH22_00955 [Tepidisphaeraceae bacterium]|jgi:hypothetical protein
MDCFVDETKDPKDGGRVIALGVLIVESGVLESLHRQLENPIDQRAGCGAIVGEIHWREMGDIQAAVAKEWLSVFFSAPCTFFVHCRCLRDQTKSQTIKRLIESLEADPHVFGGLSRKLTTVHLDFDSADPPGMLEDLRRGFGLLRAFKWDSEGSRLLQLSDILLGVAKSAQSEDALTKEASRGMQRRNDIVAEARRLATVRQRSHRFLIFEGGLMRFVFEP